MLKQHKHDVTYCTFCPKLCRFSCTVTNAEARETVTPTAKMNLLHLVQNGAVDFTPDVAEIFYHCTGCRLCRAYCKHRIDVADVMIDARREAVRLGVQPAPVKDLMEKFKKHGNPFGDDLSGKVAALRQERRINKDAKIIYFAGGVTLQRYSNVAADVITLLDACGEDFAVYGGRNLCCGTSVLLCGDEKTFAENAMAVANILNSYETVICSDPSSVETFKTRYPKAGAAIKANVIHVVEWLADRVRDGRLSFTEKSRQTVAYHDPCYLSKYLGVVEQPRELLRQVFYQDNILEFSWNKDKNYCCGGGGLVPLTSPDTASKITNERLREFREMKPDLLVTACPTCERAFERAAPDIVVKDIVTIIAERVKK